MALLWRTRRYLVGATSVELSCNPDTLAGGGRSNSTTSELFSSWAKLYTGLGRNYTQTS